MISRPRRSERRRQIAMPNQKDIARILGVSQGAVSLALRGDASVSPALRKKAKAVARKLGYRPNPYVSSLMSQIRVARKPSEQGSIALVVDRYQEQAWLRHESYSVYHRGLVRRAGELGYRIEPFFLQESGMSAARVDRILHARGIRGLILAPPYFGNRRLAITWQRYACVGTGYAWEEQQFDRVAHDHDQNAFAAVQHLKRLGYRRIGLVLPTFFATGRGTRWLDGLLVAQNGLPKADRVPVLVGSPEEGSRPAFRRWLGRWKPDVVLTLYGHEQAWLDELGLSVPRDIGLACLIRRPGTALAGIDDRYGEIGAATVELVAAKIGFNHYGVPAIPRLILIEGRWVAGRSLRRQRQD